MTFPEKTTLKKPSLIRVKFLLNEKLLYHVQKFLFSKKSYNIKTSHLVWVANQTIGFYMLHFLQKVTFLLYTHKSSENVIDIVLAGR